MADYYSFHKFVVETAGYSVIVVGKPGVWSWERFDPGTEALLEVAEIGPNDTVLDLGCGTGVIGAAAALRARKGHVTLVDCYWPAVMCAHRTLEANGISNAEVHLADGVDGLAPESFDVVLSHLPRGREVMEELIRGAAYVLRPGGKFYFVASKHAGVQGAIRYARHVFGRCSVIRQKKGYHVALTIRSDRLNLPVPVRNEYQEREITCNGEKTVLVSKPGIFAWDRLDSGTAALIGAMEIRDRQHVLDLGCGSGLAGLAAARRMFAGRVVLVDADIRAVEAARRTLAANGATHAEVYLSDCTFIASASGDYMLPPNCFDVVVTNPPFHHGIGVDLEIAHQFVRDAARVLVRSGRLYLVANTHLRYDAVIAEHFGACWVAYQDKRYRVLAAEKRKPLAR